MQRILAALPLELHDLLRGQHRGLQLLDLLLHLLHSAPAAAPADSHDGHGHRAGEVGLAAVHLQRGGCQALRARIPPSIVAVAIAVHLADGGRNAGRLRRCRRRKAVTAPSGKQFQPCPHTTHKPRLRSIKHYAVIRYTLKRCRYHQIKLYKRQ